MPIVTISTKPSSRFDNKALRIICDEVITFALNTTEGPLQPGNTTILANEHNTEINIDVLVQVKCCFYTDRYNLGQQKADLIKDLITQAYSYTRTGGSRGPNHIVVAVWVEFLSADYSGPEEEQLDKVEMTEPAMKARILKRCGF